MQSVTRPDRPTFVGIGGVKCASTWLAECLRAHPDVFMTSPKEVHFFDSQQNLGRGVDWYWKHFVGSGDYRAAGEMGATYLSDALSVSAMREVLGPVQVIVSLRNPVNRLLSEYKHRIRSGELPRNEFRNVTHRTLPEAIERCSSLRRNSLYASRLKEFAEVFSRERIFVAIKEEIDTNPRQQLTALYEFLGVEPHFEPSVAQKVVSKGIVPRWMFLEQARQKTYRAVRSYTPKLIDFARRTRVGELYRRFNSLPDQSDLVVEPGIYDQLYDEFAAEITATEQLLGRSLNLWRARLAA